MSPDQIPLEIAVPLIVGAWSLLALVVLEASR